MHGVTAKSFANRRLIKLFICKKHCKVKGCEIKCFIWTNSLDFYHHVDFKVKETHGNFCFCEVLI